MGHRSDFPTSKNFSLLDDLYLASSVDTGEMSKNEIFHLGFNCFPKRFTGGFMKIKFSRQPLTHKQVFNLLWSK